MSSSRWTARVRTGVVTMLAMALCTSAIGAGAASAAGPYVLTRIDPIGPPNGPIPTSSAGWQTSASRINEKGQVVGVTHVPVRSEDCAANPSVCGQEYADAYFWDDGAMQSLDWSCVPFNWQCPAWSEIAPSAVDDTGRAGGVISGNSFQWYMTWPDRLLPPPSNYGGGYGTTLSDMNDAGQVAGTDHTANWAEGFGVPWRAQGSTSKPLAPPSGHYGDWTDGYVVDDAGSLVADTTSAPRWTGGTCAMNSSGDVLGWLQEKPDPATLGPQRYVVWGAGIPQELSGGPFTPSCRGRALNDADAIAGSVPADGGGSRAAIWRGSTVQLLDAPAGSQSAATVINDRGDVLGWIRDADTTRPALWVAGTLIDPRDLLPAGSGWTDVGFVDLNDRGQLLGGGSLAGQQHAFVLTPPEVASTYRERVLANPALIGYWRLGDPTGTIAYDAKGSRHGTYMGGVELNRPGALATANPAAGFAGAQRVALPGLPDATDFTVEGWTRLATDAGVNLNGNNTLFGAAGNVRVIIRPGPPATTTGIYAGVWLDGREYMLQPGTTQSNVGTWAYWAVTRSGSTLSVYRNGVRIAQRNDLPPAATVNLSGAIGMLGVWKTYWMRGAIDEVAVYGTALSGDEIAAHFASA